MSASSSQTKLRFSTLQKNNLRNLLEGITGHKDSICQLQVLQGQAHSQSKRNQCLTLLTWRVCSGTNKQFWLTLAIGQKGNHGLEQVGLEHNVPGKNAGQVMKDLPFRMVSISMHSMGLLQTGVQDQARRSYKEMRFRPLAYPHLHLFQLRSTILSKKVTLYEGNHVSRTPSTNTLLRKA